MIDGRSVADRAQARQGQARSHRDFDDGQSFALPAELLRVLSPSAEVQGHSEAQRVTVAGKKNVGIVRIEPVGNYAVRIVFDDGHDTGLFVWDYLRELGENRDARWQGYLNDLAAKRLVALSSSGLGFLGEQSALALDAAAIAGQRPVRPDHAVAGDRHGDAVRARRRGPPRAPLLARRSPWRFPHSSR